MVLLGWIWTKWRSIALLACAIIGVAVGWSGVGTGVERSIRAVDWQLRRHPASGQLHIVEIDARSIAAMERWPWARSNYARLVDQLRNAGARTIAFDVDFSSASSPIEDSAFAAALARAGDRVVLPTFSPAVSGGRQGWTDSLPIAALRAHATLAAATILPETDGSVRNAPMGTVTDATPRPSLSTMISGTAGAAGDHFPIDFAIDPATIPRHSFIDLRDGRFDRAGIAGKDILIGTTATEIGDRYAVPNHGTIPGVVVQALAAETLSAGVPHQAGWLIPLLLGLALGWAVLRARTRLMLVVHAVCGPVILFAASVFADAALRWHFPLVAALCSLLLAGSASVAMRMLRAARRRRLHDAASGLPNRRALRDAMCSDPTAGVIAARFAEFDKLMASLDDERATRELIRRVRDRIAAVSEGATIYRIDDTMLAWRVHDETQIEARLASLRTIMLSPIEIGGRRVGVTLAFGIASGKPDERPEHIAARAAMAADHALAEGRNWHFHDAQDEDAAERTSMLLGELDGAIEKGEIRLVYQPKFDLRTDRVVGVEALVRWHHGTRGMLRPDLFIPLAERSDRIAVLTLHVIQQTIRDLLRWRASGHDVTGAVNLSAKLLRAPDFVEALRALIAQGDIAPELLTFEVTESATMTDPSAVIAALQSFRDIGISLSIDDYGTGQSTLSHLKHLPVNELKIDRSFVQFSHQNRSDGALVRSTIDLAHDLGLKVVAEGVEDEGCLNFLRTIGCDVAQGYLIGMPVPAPAFEAMLGLTAQAA